MARLSVSIPDNQVESLRESAGVTAGVAGQYLSVRRFFVDRVRCGAFLASYSIVGVSVAPGGDEKVWLIHPATALLAFVFVRKTGGLNSRIRFGITHRRRDNGFGTMHEHE
jgi:hypothetical protein